MDTVVVEVDLSVDVTGKIRVMLLLAVNVEIEVNFGCPAAPPKYPKPELTMITRSTSATRRKVMVWAIFDALLGKNSTSDKKEFQYVRKL